MSNILTQEGYSYSFDPLACATCEGKCCTGESGYIYVTKEEIEAIANFLNLEVKEFVQTYLFKKGYKYSIKERKIGESYECVFYDKNANGCTIYEVSPSQCKTFPFWDYFKNRLDELKEECPGIIEKASKTNV